MIPRTLHTLLHTIVDYAGLFPPAGLSMDKAVGLYREYHASTNAWMLGRFVVPVARLDEMVRSMEVAGSAQGNPWHVSALMGTNHAADVAAALAFNEAKHHAAVDVFEVKASTVEEIGAIARVVPPGIKTYVEIPIENDPRELITALAATKLRAKMRTGGVTPGSIPQTEHVARFIRACYAANVGFKATAGLHHPLRSEHGLSYEADAPRDVMHGFLNVFLAAAFHYNGLTSRDTIDLLNATTLDGVTMDDDKLAWREYVVTRNEVSTVRRRFATAFGSCSFTEPVEDLVKLELLT
ncbi:MAG TPA: hypothetical protein VFH33_09150 [Candidatus Krumholzibacteria bacterium]|nr:hypothetical protein [Candidatus Krumholzibacteria bacterium]